MEIILGVLVGLCLLGAASMATFLLKSILDTRSVLWRYKRL